MGELEDPDSADVTQSGATTSPVELSDDSVVLKPWVASDASFLAEASRDPAIERYNGPAPTSAADAIAVIERIAQCWRAFESGGDPTGAAFAIVDARSGKPVGMCGVDAWSSTHVAQFGYWLTASARGRGLATRAVTLRTGWLFELGAARVFLTIQSENLPSAAVARRAGFTYEGTLRAYDVWQGQRKDVDVFAVLPDEWPINTTGQGRTLRSARIRQQPYIKRAVALGGLLSRQLAIEISSTKFAIRISGLPRSPYVESGHEYLVRRSVTVQVGPPLCA
jgi:RimJ/RimL family protein N-acetyltransferase